MDKDRDLRITFKNHTIMALKVNPKIYTYFTKLHRQTRCFFIHFILKDIAFFKSHLRKQSH